MEIRARDGRLLCEVDGISKGTLNCADLYGRDLTEADLTGVIMEYLFSFHCWREFLRRAVVDAQRWLFLKREVLNFSPE